MKITLLLMLLTTLSASLHAQNGYVKFNKNHVVKGFVRIHNEGRVHEHQIEIATSKDDPAPKRYHKKDVVEYAIQNDTFRILKKFFPYDVEEIYYEIIDAKVIRSGDVSLLQIHNSH